MGVNGPGPTGNKGIGKFYSSLFPFNIYLPTPTLVLPLLPSLNNRREFQILLKMDLIISSSSQARLSRINLSLLQNSDPLNIGLSFEVSDPHTLDL